MTFNDPLCAIEEEVVSDLKLPSIKVLDSNKGTYLGKTCEADGIATHTV
jgi:hypothetical protein